MNRVTPSSILLACSQVLFEFGEGCCKPKDDERQSMRRASDTFLEAKAAADRGDRQAAASIMEAGIRQKALRAHMVATDIQQLFR